MRHLKSLITDGGCYPGQERPSQPSGTILLLSVLLKPKDAVIMRMLPFFPVPRSVERPLYLGLGVMYIAFHLSSLHSCPEMCLSGGVM